MYIKTHSISDWKILHTATSRYLKTILAAKCLFYTSLIHSSSSNPHTLWNTINNILHRTVECSLPSSSPLSALRQNRCKCFKKILLVKYKNFTSTYSPTHLLLPFISYHLLLLYFTILLLPHYRKFQMYFSYQSINQSISTFITR